MIFSRYVPVKVIDPAIVASIALDLDTKYSQEREYAEMLGNVAKSFIDEYSKARASSNEDISLEKIISTHQAMFDYKAASDKALKYAFARDVLIDLLDNHTVTVRIKS